MASPLAKWVYENSFNKENPQRCSPTHYILGGFSRNGGGGVLYIPQTAYDIFINKLAESLRMKFPISIAELAGGPQFKFFLDLDLKFNNEHDFDIDSIAGVVISEMRKWYKGEILCFMSSPQKQDDDSTWKQGIHMYFPYMIVTTETARKTRDKLVSGLKSLNAHMDWDDCIDNAVYRDNHTTSLRVPFSVKYKQCVCKSRSNKEREGFFCDRGCSQGKILINNPYTLKYIDIDGTRTLPELVNYVDILKRVSIRDELTIDDSIAIKAQKRKQQGADEPTAYDDLTLSLRQYFKKIHPNYETLSIEKIEHKGVNSFIQVVGDDAKFCLNKGSHHSSNRIYFMINSRSGKMTCHCYSSKRNCKEFKTRSVNVSDAILKLVNNKNVPSTQPKKKKKSDYSTSGFFVSSQNLHVRFSI